MNHQPFFVEYRFKITMFKIEIPGLGLKKMTKNNKGVDDLEGVWGKLSGDELV